MSSGQNESIEKERAWIRIQLKNLGHNMSVLESLLPKKCKIMAIVKANAYGHGANEVSLYLNSLGYQSFAVATAQEGIALRQAGVVGEILVLGYTDPNTVRDLLAFSLTQTATDKTHAYALAREADLCKAILPIQIKVDTGMNRLGESWAHSEQIAEYFTLRSLDIRGIFSHLCVADSEKETDIRYTKDQIEKFNTLLEALKQKGITLPQIHLQNSFGVISYQNIKCDYARVGLALYGAVGRRYDFRPALELCARVVLTREIQSGENVGYGRQYVADRPSRVAVVSIGYADGVPRSLYSGGGEVLLHGRRVPIAGRICMDQMMIDITDVDQVKRGDVVTLIGRDGAEEITAEEFALKTDTIANEVFCRLTGYRVKRFYEGELSTNMSSALRG